MIAGDAPAAVVVPGHATDGVAADVTVVAIDAEGDAGVVD